MVHSYKHSIPLVPPKIAPIHVDRITPPSSGGVTAARVVEPATPGGGGVGSLDLPSYSPQMYGLGTRTNPYDLRSGVELHLTCQTKCGYPKAMPEWTVNTMGGLLLSNWLTSAQVPIT